MDRFARDLLVIRAYEPGEPVLDQFTVIRVADSIGDAIPNAAQQEMEIEPYWGEVHVTWGNRRIGKRVKAIFAPGGRTFSVYHEEDRDGQVQCDMIRSATGDQLRQWVEWVYV
ncbi:MAG: hypothetical protein LAO20_02210 [Acidobacteriia bacterium]|nr:hypothetical protein [Terriglobia bacterium]